MQKQELRELLKSLEKKHWFANEAKLSGGGKSAKKKLRKSRRRNRKKFGAGLGLDAPSRINPMSLSRKLSGGSKKYSQHKKKIVRTGSEYSAGYAAGAIAGAALGAKVAYERAPYQRHPISRVGGALVGSAAGGAAGIGAVYANRRRKKNNRKQIKRSSKRKQ